MHDMSEWRGFVRENTTAVSCHDDMIPLNGGSRSWSSLQLKGMKGKMKGLMKACSTVSPMWK